MKPLSEHLTVLIATAEDLIRRPAHQLPASLPVGFAELADFVRRSHDQPCDGEERATRRSLMMCMAIEGFFAGNAGDDSYQSDIGYLLPKVRGEAWRARKNERGIAEETRR